MGKFQIALLVFVTFLVIAAIAVYLNLDLVWKLLYPLKYEEYVFKYAEEFDNDPYLVTAIMYRESKFNPQALSSKGAIGLMQIMPDTAKWISQQVDYQDFEVDDLYRPEVNIYLGSWYLRNLIQEFEGNLILVLAAYNAGRGNVRKWIAEGRWSGEVYEIEEIPFPETRNFVRSVINLYQRYLQLYEGR